MITPDAGDNGHAARQLGRKLGELEKRRAHARIRRQKFARNRITQRIAVEYLIQHGRCCADHVRPLLPPEFLNENGDDRWIGAAFGGLAEDGVIVEAGQIRSSRPETHGRKITLWGLPENGRETALRWLANHPVPLPEPAAATSPTAPPTEFPPPAEDLGHPAVSTVSAPAPAHAPPLPGPLWPASSSPPETNTPAAVSGHGRES